MSSSRMARRRTAGAFATIMAVAAATGLATVAWSPAAFAQASGPMPTPPAEREATPRLADGTPNLGPVEPNRGYWLPRQFQDYRDILIEPEEIPFQPWAEALAGFREESLSLYDPQGLCLPPSGPRLFTTPFPMELIQLPEQGRIIQIFEGATHIWRIIYTDGRALPEEPEPSWKGYAVGRWEGDTLVVETVGFNDGHWLDMFGKPRTEQLHLTERITRTDLHTLSYEATIDDPGAYTQPWKIGFDIVWDPDGEIMEYICMENNQWIRALMNQGAE